MLSHMKLTVVIIHRSEGMQLDFIYNLINTQTNLSPITNICAPAVTIS